MIGHYLLECSYSSSDMIAELARDIFLDSGACRSYKLCSATIMSMASPREALRSPIGFRRSVRGCGSDWRRDDPEEQASAAVGPARSVYW